MNQEKIAVARRVAAVIPSGSVPLCRDVWGSKPGERRVFGGVVWEALNDKTDWVPALLDIV